MKRRFLRVLKLDPIFIPFEVLLKKQSHRQKYSEAKLLPMQVFFNSLIINH